MERTKIVRGLRIIWTVLWGILCVLLAVLWARSSGRWERVWFAYTKSIGVSFQSESGQLKLHYSDWSDEPSVRLHPWGYRAEPRTVDPSAHNASFYFRYNDGSQGHFGVRRSEFGAPHWFVILTASLVAGAPWIRWSFSLRTLLFVTAVVASLLGLIIYLTH